MPIPTKCPGCGADTTMDWADGHCVPCLLQLGLAPEVANIEPFGPGGQIGHYRLIEEIGEGGFGIVFLAEQSEPVRRQVALKLIKPGMDTRQVLARFEAERQVLASLGHPHIAKVFDAGVTESGHPFFVMEYVRGDPITAYCDREKLSIRERLELFREVCDAIQHAHQKAVIHRDLKPSNILVTSGGDGTIGTPRIIDFGIAKSMGQELGNGTAITRMQQFLGTPAYMSPEQAGRGEGDIDTRADIYSLGVLLYELLVGATPFLQTELARIDWDEVPRFLRETQPLRPSARVASLVAAELVSAAANRQIEPGKFPKLLRGDLDWIVMKCLEKDRTRRYETAQALQADVQHFLLNEPVVARPPTTAYRLQKLVRRNQAAFVAATVVLLALLTTLGITIWSLHKEREAHQRAVAARNQEHEARVLADASRERALSEAAKTREVAAFLTELLRSVGPSAGGDSKMLRQILDKTISSVGRDLPTQPDVEAELRNTLAEACGELGLYPQMEEMAREALRLSRPNPQAENVVAAKSLEQLGGALMHLGRLDEAEVVSRESLRMEQHLTGNEGAGTAASLNNLGLILRERGRFADAEKAFREALAIDVNLFGPENGRVATDLTNLGAVLWNEGNFADAEAAYRSVLAMRRRLSGDEHPETAIALNNLAMVLMSERKLDEAEPMAREALAMDRKFLEDEHPELANTLANLANILAASGKFAEAETLDREAVSIDRKLALAQPTNLAMHLDNLAQNLTALGKLAEAESIRKESTLVRADTVRKDLEAESGE